MSRRPNVTPFCNVWLPFDLVQAKIYYFVMSHDDEIEEPCEFMAGSSLLNITTLLSLVAIGFMVVDI